MAYGVKYYVEHKEKIDSTTVTYRIEILEDGFSGTATQQDAEGDIFQFGYDGSGIKKIWDNPIQKGTLSLNLLVENDSDKTIVTDIRDNSEKTYQLRYKKDGNIKWTGFAIPDLLDYPEAPYPYSAKIVAKDFHFLQTSDYDTNTSTSYKKYATILADILSSTGLSLNIDIYDEVTASGLDGTDDYFNQAYLDEYQLQNFTAFSEGNFEPKNKMQALKDVIPKGFVLRQYNNKWILFDLAHLAQNPTSATRYEYNSSGSKTGKTSSVDLTTNVSDSTKFLLKSSRNKPYFGIKRLTVGYNHKTAIQNILFKDEYVHTVSDSTSEEKAKISDTTGRYFEIGGEVEVTSDTNPGSNRSGTATLLIQIDDYELELSSDTWNTSNGTFDVSVNGSDDTLTGTFGTSGLSDKIPSDIDESEIKIEFRWASISGENVQQVKWHNISASVVNGDDVADGAAKNFRLTQSSDYSIHSTLGKIIVGQGPTSQSSSAIRDISENNLSGFKHVGGTSYQYEKFLLKNIMNMQRSVTENLDVDLWAFYDPHNIINYDSKNYFFLNGSITGRNSNWSGTIVELSWSDSSDTFEEFNKISNSDSGTTIATSSGDGSTGDFDNRYVNESGDTMSGNLDMGSNDLQNVANFTGGAIGTDVQAWDTDLDTYSTNPLTATELGELQNIDSSTFTTSGWDNLSDLSALSHSDSNFIVSDGTDWVVESGSTAQSSLGLKDQSADLDLNTLAINGDDLFDLFYRQDEIDSFFGLYYSKRDLESGNEDLHFNTLKLTNLTNDRVAIVGSNGLLEDDSQLTFDGTTFESAVQMSNDIDNFVSGFTGANWAIRDTGSNNWQMDIDDVYVRGALFANEFIINQILALNGSDILSPGRGKIESVSGSPSTETVTVSDPQGNDVASFVADDIVLVQTVRPDNNNIVKRLVRKVGSVSGNDVTFAALGDAPADNGSFEEGDVVVVIGNTSDTSRQSSIYRTAVDSDNPYTIIQDGVDSWTAWKSAGKTKMKYGNLNGSYGYGSDTFGIAAGSPNSDHVTIDPSNGFRLIDGADSNKVLGQFSSQIITFGDTSETNEYIKFDNSSGTVTADIDISTFRLNTPKLDINSATPRIDVGSSHFLDGSTDKASFSSGVLVADGGAGTVDLAGFTADAKTLRSASDRVVIASENMEDYDGSGRLVIGGRGNDASSAKEVTIWGGAATTDGKVSMFNSGSDWGLIGKDGSDNTVFELGSTNQIAGWTFDNTDLYAGGDGTKSGASVRLDAGNGQIFYDAMGQLLYGRTLEADFTEDAETGLMNSSWTSTVTSPGDGTEKSGNPSSKVLTTIEHKFGISTVRIKGKARVRNENGGGGSTECRVRIVYGNADSTYTTVTTSSESQSSFEDFSIELDVSGETADTQVDLEVFVRARVSGDNSATKRHADMREDIKIMSFT